MITEIAFILDRSGSMQSMRAAAISSFNDFLQEQQADPGINRLTLVLFDDWIETHFSSIPVSEVIALTDETFVPRGSTALLDAIGETVDILGQRLAAMPEADRPNHVVVAIMTDGEENASERFKWSDISARIHHQTEKYGWEFLFLGAGADAIATAGKLNIQAANSAQYTADSDGHRAASSSLSRKIASSRRLKSGDATLEEQQEAIRPMSDILQEEDQKRRGK